MSSLPGAHGIGDLGPSARAFVEFLAQAGQSIWQVLPIGPTGYGNSPYQSLSAFAGNPLFVSLEDLAADGWLNASDLPEGDFPTGTVDFDRVNPWRGTRLLAAATVAASSTRRRRTRGGLSFDDFRAAQASWLEDYALFVALKEAHADLPWTRWERDLMRRRPAALKTAGKELNERIEAEVFIQWQFARQWDEIRKFARERQVRIVGDMPIFVAHDSADVWAHQDLFSLDKDGQPKVVAGVPPDYFSATGQLWGNPLYRWTDRSKPVADWWIERFRHAFSQFDLVRIDHFRGFESYWEVPGGAPDASTGRWVEGPGIGLFRRAERKLGPLPLIAEDLGLITPEVESLRDELGAPGMRVLQFAFGDDAKAADYQPHNYIRHCVAYTGTHDNDTTAGWFHSQAGKGTTRNEEQVERERRRVLDYLGTDGRHIAWDMIRLAWASVAHTAMAPMQDILGLGNEARMNLPGSLGGNWGWRCEPGDFTPALAERLSRLTATYERLPRRAAPPQKSRPNAQRSRQKASRRDGST